VAAKERGVIATISDAAYAFLATGGFFALLALGLTIRALRPRHLRSWRAHRAVKRRVIAELERRQQEQLSRMGNAPGPSQHEAFLRYLELQNSIESAKRI
jgi:heme exporter protein D